MKCAQWYPQLRDLGNGRGVAEMNAGTIYALFIQFFLSEIYFADQ